MTDLATPSPVTASVVGPNVVVSWNLLCPQGADIERDGVLVARTANGVKTWTDNGGASAAHTYVVTALSDRSGTAKSPGPVTPPPPPPTHALLGFFPGNGGTGADAAAQLSVIGAAPCQLFHEFDSFWGPVPNYPSIGPDYNLPTMVSGQRLLITVPLCATGTNGAPVTGMMLSDTILPANLATYTTLAQKLVSAGQGNAIVRLGHECNGGWYGWSHQGRAAYKLAFQTVAVAMREVSSELQFEWNVNGGWAPLTSQQPNPGTPFQDQATGETWQEAYLNWYPGANVVDYLGQDTYAGQYSMGLTNTPPDTGWMAATYDALVQMAVSLGKPWATSEYGSLFGDNPQIPGTSTAAEADRLNRHGWFRDTLSATGPIDGDGFTAEFLTAMSVVVKGQRPASSWDSEIGGWTATTPPPAAAYHTLYDWTGDKTYMTVGSPPALNPAYAKSDAAYKAAWA